MTTTMYGIPNCDTIKKAQKWLKDHNIPFTFHDYRKDGLDEQLVNQLIDIAGWDKLLNKRSTSYRALSDEQKASLDQHNIATLFIEFPTLIKRPLIIQQQQSIVGFNDKQYQTFFVS